MKQKDVAMIVLIVFISAIASFFLSKTLFGGANVQQSAEHVQVVTTDFPKPSTDYFNDKAFDPTQLISIGNNTNTNPFNAPTKP